MIADLKPYPAMKDSGVHWLGDVPEYWEVHRLKYLLREQDSRSSSGKEQLLRVSQYTGVTQRTRSDGLDEPDTRAESLVGYKSVEPNELVVNIMLAWNGSMGVSKFHGIASPAYCVYRFGDSARPWFFHHLLRSPVYKARIKAVSTGVVESRLRLYTDDLYRLEALVPPLPEQAAIVRFLDYMDQRIRKYVRAKQKLIKLLEEQKQAIIHRAVTRGLDPNVHLKPSGIPWLGEIPAHWKLLQLRRVVRFVTSGSRGWASYYRDHGDIFLQSGNLGRSMSLNLSTIQYVTPPIGSEGIRTKVAKDDILVCITGALTGNVALVEMDLPCAYVNQHVALVRPKRDMIFPRFLTYILHSRIGQTQFKTNEYGGTKQGLGLGDVKSVIIVIPPEKEQQDISDKLDRQIASFSILIARTEREIALLREYRSRLTTDIVTGKLDVREAAKRLPKEAGEPEAPIDGDEPGDEAELEPALSEEAV